MDDTHGNALLDATATRKRRSSILKSQRPPRTPLTELELNVATPPDTSKSRRVSFSRRTGVAEFITDEATNAWKTMYVEQNKSTESSFNDSEKYPPKQTVGHLGKRIFEHQFQEEIFNFDNKPSDNRIIAQEFNMSLRGDLTQQFAALERDFNEKNIVPQNNFELSSLTDHKSKIFIDDVTNGTLGEMSNQININFSSLDAVGAQDKCYDLDEIEKDLLKPRSNCNRHFSTVTSVSEQIEIDLNIKPVGLRSEELDMSITDTVRNPQVEEVLHNYKTKNDRTSNVDDWTLDKENIVVNPYVAPKESINFAINEVPDQVLVFDGKRLTIQSEHKNTFERNSEEDFNKTLWNDIPERPPQRKTIVLNLNDDLPNFIEVAAAPGASAAGKNVTISNENQQRREIDFSTLNMISNKTDVSNSHKTIIYDSGDVTNISVTQAIITNILLEKEKRKTIVFGNDTGELSMTQALPSNVLAASKCVSQNKTVLYDVDNISITQAVPVNILLHNKSLASSKSVASSQSDFDLSFTQAVPHNMLIANKSSESNKRNTIVFDNDKADISITRVLPSNILVSDNNKNNQKADVQNLSEIVLATLDKENLANKADSNEKQSNTTLVQTKDSKDCNMPKTKMISLNILANMEGEILQHRERNRRLSCKRDQFITNMSLTESVPHDILLVDNPVPEATSDNDNDCDISVTQALPSNIILQQKNKFSTQEPPDEVPSSVNTIDSSNDLKIPPAEEMSRTSLSQFSDKETHSSVSNSVNDSTDELCQEPSERAEHSKSYGDMSMTRVLPLGPILNKRNHKRGTIVFDNDEMGDISVTRAIPTNIILDEIKCNKDNTLLIFENANIDPMSSVSASDGMLTKSEENVPTKLNTSYADITNSEQSSDNGNEVADICQIYKKSIASRTLQQAKEELQKSLLASNNVNRDISIDNIYHDHTKPLSDHEETLLQSMNYMDCVDQKLETQSLKSATEHKNKDVFVYQAVTTHNVSKHQGLRTEQGDVKSERAINKYEDNTSRKSNAGKESEASLLIRDVSHYADERKTEESPPTKQEHKKSILAELLHMSGESLNVSVDGMDDKNVMVGLESVLALEKFALDCDKHKLKGESAKSIECTSEETKNNSTSKEDVAQQPSNAEPKEVRSCNIQAENIHRPPLSLSYEHENDQQAIVEQENVEEKSVEQENVEEKSVQQENDQQNKKSASSHSDTKSEANNKDLENKNETNKSNYFKEADDTKELLEMLTDFTDKTMPGQPELDSNKSSKEMIDVPIDMPDEADVESRESCDNPQKEVELPQPSQEAMAGIESEDCRTNDVTDEDTDEVMYKEVNLRRKSGHVSREVVKTLQFDESNDEIKCNSNSTPLKKIAPVDISDSKDSKAKVIPTFMNDVSDGLKSLMEDLVKPTADLMPFHKPGVARLNRKSTTTVNKELQTNIITSSQIDIIDINSYPVSEPNIILARRHEDREVAHAATEVGTSVDSIVEERLFSGRKKHRAKQVLIFDQKNPLNNVILCPSGKTNIHRYSPKKLEQPKLPGNNDLEMPPRIPPLQENEVTDVQRISTQYNIETNSVHLDKQFDCLRDNLKEPFDQIVGREFYSGTDRSPIKSAEVNTVIAMKSNKDLLQASSSLTLLDEEVNNVIINRPPKTSPVKVIFKLNEPENVNVESSFELSDVDSNRAQKRNYQRAKYDQYKARSADVTPKPLTKMPKLSSSPRHVQNYRLESDRSSKRASELRSEPSRRCANPNLLNKTKPKVRTTTIVQHFTVCKMNAEDQEKFFHRPVHDDDLETSSSSTLKTETISRKDLRECTSRELTSFTSSNAMKELEYMPSMLRMAASQETLHTDIDDCSDLGSKIESLSFLSSRECECEGCEPDAWRFLLLRRRLRLTVRVAHDPRDPPPDAPPSVPVISITIEPLHKESEAVSCASVRLACEAMRYECVRCGGGRGVGALLRRCVGVARAAARWARLMAEARAHLAFTLAHCGNILLTVANFHVRRVWQVTLRVELVVEDARELAWPRASHVHVRDVTPGAQGAPGTPVAADAGGAAAGGDEPPAGTRPHAPDLRRVLARVPHDWGHVPRTIWKVFRHLKNKTEDDELYWPPQSR